MQPHGRITAGATALVGSDRDSSYHETSPLQYGEVFRDMSGGKAGEIGQFSLSPRVLGGYPFLGVMRCREIVQRLPFGSLIRAAGYLLFPYPS